MKSIFDMYSEFLYPTDINVVNDINEKYNIPYMDAFIDFVNSKTYKMLEDKKCEMYQFRTPAIFEMWENEKITGDPRNSIYIRGEW